MFKYFRIKLREYIFIILTATIFSIAFFSKSFSKENIFVIDNVKIETQMSINFSREKYINKALKNSFDILKSRILLSRDFNKVNNIKLFRIKSLIDSFQILEETYRNDQYVATFKIFYNDNKIKNLLRNKNISFSQPKKISAIFFPILFINNEMQNFNENFFFNEWANIKIEGETINFILPLEDLDDIYKIKKMENNIEKLDAADFVNKYNIKNYAFLIINYDNQRLNIHIKTNFEGNKMSKNISYELNNIRDKVKLNLILIDMKKQITDLWRETNIVNLFMPLSIRVKFQHINLSDLDQIKNTFYKISIINNYTLEELNIKNSFFKIYYYGNPKRLRTELSTFGYQLKNEQGFWEIYVDE